ncbi:sex peptide receptor-like [Tubulanus polymorphus]|uniref:sex peptide receptor-like n=1 Tax=Tubulanus polymorphus TaxID=672921 RepID=UPI003DA551E3
MAVWILVLVTIERFISVIFPVKAKTLCTQPRMLAALACVFTILLLVDGHLLYGVRSNVDEVTQKVTSCTHVDGNYRGFWNQEWVWIDLCVLSIVPFFVILICNIMIISKVRVSQKSINKLRSTNPGHGKQPESVSKVTNMTAMLLTVNFVFLITTLPSSIYLAFWTDLPVDLTDHELAIHDLVFSCVNVWTYVSNAINFLLYCVSGPRFREQFVALFKRARVQPSNEETYENEQPNHRPRSASSDAFTKAIPNGIDRSNTRSVFLVDSSNV